MDKKIIVAGYVGLEGSLEIVKENKKELKSHFSKYFMKQVEECERYLVSSKAFHEMGLKRSDVLDKVELMKSNMLDEIEPSQIEKIKKVDVGENVIVPLGETGAFTSLWSALWNLCEMWRCGVEVEFSQIPIRQETIEICQFAGLNPYQLSSKGSYLIFTSQAEEVIEELRVKEITANVIGKTTHKRERLIKRGEYIRHLPRAI